MSNPKPHDFLTSMDAMSLLKRKAQLSRSGTESLKKARLDPTPEAEDTMVMEDDDRVGCLSAEDPDELSIFRPLGIDLRQIERDVKQMGKDLEQIQKDRKQIRLETDALKKISDEERKRTLVTFEANALLDLTRLIMKKSHIEPTAEADPSTTQLQKFAIKTSDSQLMELEIPRNTWPLLRKLDKVNPWTFFF